MKNLAISSLMIIFLQRKKFSILKNWLTITNMVLKELDGRRFVMKPIEIKDQCCLKTCSS